MGFLFKVPSEDGVPLALRVRAVTENGEVHPIQTVIPATAQVDWSLMKNNNERDCLICDPNSFDQTTQSVFINITDDERGKGQKK